MCASVSKGFVRRLCPDQKRRPVVMARDIIRARRADATFSFFFGVLSRRLCPILKQWRSVMAGDFTAGECRGVLEGLLQAEGAEMEVEEEQVQCGKGRGRG